VKDWEKAKQFYSQVLGLPVYYSDDAFGWAEYGGTNETRVAIERVDTTELRTEQGGGLAIFTWMTPGR
jgi:catechol 2,3-dioxygenase-like lactoylglutathione lyase family enzyme